MYENFNEFKEAIQMCETTKEVSSALYRADNTLAMNTCFMKDEEWPVLSKIVNDKIKELQCATKSQPT